MLTVIAAMEYELVGLRRALRQSGPANPKAAREFGRPTPSATELQVELHAVGVGREPAQAAVTKLLAERRRAGGNHTDALLLLGFAGGLDPGLRSGDLCLPSHFIREDGPVADAGPAADAHPLEPDAAMRQQAACVLADAGQAWSAGDSLTVTELVATPEAKAERFRQYRAGVVDMEDYWFADLAARQGMPFLAVRAVLDPAQQGLPPYVLGLASRNRDLGRAVVACAARPWRVAGLLRLSRQAGLAQQSLSHFALAFIRQRLAESGRPLTAAQ